MDQNINGLPVYDHTDVAKGVGDKNPLMAMRLQDEAVAKATLDYYRIRENKKADDECANPDKEALKETRAILTKAAKTINAVKDNGWNRWHIDDEGLWIGPDLPYHLGQTKTIDFKKLATMPDEEHISTKDVRLNSAIKRVKQQEVGQY